MGERGLWSKQLTGKASYRQNDPLKGLFQAGELRPIERVKGEYQLNTVTPGNRSRPYILGYTGSWLNKEKKIHGLTSQSVTIRLCLWLYLHLFCFDKYISTPFFFCLRLL